MTKGKGNERQRFELVTEKLQAQGESIEPTPQGALTIGAAEIKKGRQDSAGLATELGGPQGLRKYRPQIKREQRKK